MQLSLKFCHFAEYTCSDDNLNLTLSFFCLRDPCCTLAGWKRSSIQQYPLYSSGMHVCMRGGAIFFYNMAIYALIELIKVSMWVSSSLLDWTPNGKKRTKGDKIDM